MCRRHTAGRDGVEGGKEGGRERGREKGRDGQLYDCSKKRVNVTLKSTDECSDGTVLMLAREW